MKKLTGIFLKYIALVSVWSLIYHASGLRKQLLDYSLEVLPQIQTKERSWLVGFLAVIGGEIGQTLAVLFSHHYMRKSYALTVMTAVAMGNLINSLLKTYWHEPRPFFIKSEIVPYSCKNFEYGYPSGHAMGFMLVYRTLTNLYVTHHSFKVRTVLFTAAIMVSYNRAQQGVHSFD